MVGLSVGILEAKILSKKAITDVIFDLEDNFIIEPTMNTNELNDSENTASLDLSSINVINMGLGGVDASASASAIGSSSQYQNNNNPGVVDPNGLMKHVSADNFPRNSPPQNLPPPSSSATGSSSGNSNSNNNNNAVNNNNPMNQSKSSSKKRKLEDLGLENISDSEGSSNTSNSSSMYLQFS